MLKYLAILLFLIIFQTNAYAADIFEYPAKAKEVAEKLPQLNSVTCTFNQEKTFKNKTLKSGGNFKFEKDKGVTFETLYPVKSTSSYSTNQNKQINEVVTGVANKDYSFINKNFNLFYVEQSGEWTVALKPKDKSPAASQLESIIINGQTNIKKISIKTLNGSSTSINFSCGL